MMTEDLIREIAQQILREQLLYNWVFYLVLLALLFLSSVSSAFVGSYIRKRGETYASKADFDQLILQLRATTTVAEEVKTAIAHSDWTSKEWKILRRTKLEELLRVVYEVHGWLDKENDVRLFGAPSQPEQSPIWKIRVISSLYFPELQAEVRSLNAIYYPYMSWMIETHRKVIDAKGDSAKQKALSDIITTELKPHYQELLNAIVAIEQKSPAIMKEIVGA